ncbi:Uncharacterised protein [Mycobacterium tuberculosis]|uniref:Uncharacterized protein n=1 Tax=Mycobacterium tuberculosis TaxID=1773 RepID=A0A916P9M0_MYCTX|nr:Uncharacterised protein [Mycobacterium tuberculosis]COY53291.1 Uncharacterised protein [Mycobacterium tuberculosis]CPA44609.1 Uncharacterised protein [Mycobacterium tuberculosis]
MSTKCRGPSHGLSARNSSWLKPLGGNRGSKICWANSVITSSISSWS